MAGRDFSGKDSNNLTESKLNDTEINEIFTQVIINDEFDIIEDWADKVFNNIKKKYLEGYNNFNVDIPYEINNKENDKESSADYEDESKNKFIEIFAEGKKSEKYVLKKSVTDGLILSYTKDSKNI